MPVFSSQERNATIPDFLKEVEENTKRNRAMWGMLSKKVRIDYNCGGRNFEWRIAMNELKARTYNGTTAPQYITIDRYQTAVLDYKMYQLGEKLDKPVLDKNKGKEQIINLYNDALSRVQSDFFRTTGQDCFNDGSTNADRWDGVESFLSAGSAMTNTKVRTPNDTYAGLSTAPGGITGSWTSGNWPDGTTTEGPGYDFWSPIIIDSTSTAWGTSPAASFANYGNSQLRFGINRSLKYRASQYGDDGTSQAMGDQTGMVLWTMEMKEAFQELFSGTERTNMEAVPKDFSFGFQVLNFDGWMLVHDFDVPANTAYGFLWSAIKYRSIYARIMEALRNQSGEERGVVVVPDGSGVIVGAWMHGNFKCNPRGFFKIYPYT